MPNLAVSIDPKTYEGFQKIMVREDEPNMTHVMRKLAKAYAAGWITFQGPYPFVDPGEIADARTMAKITEREETGETIPPRETSTASAVVLRHGMLLSELAPKSAEDVQSVEFMDGMLSLQGAEEGRWDAQIGKWVAVKEKK